MTKERRGAAATKSELGVNENANCLWRLGQSSLKVAVQVKAVQVIGGASEDKLVLLLKKKKRWKEIP